MDQGAPVPVGLLAWGEKSMALRKLVQSPVVFSIKPDMRQSTLEAPLRV